MSVPTTPWYPATHDDAERIASALEIMAIAAAGGIDSDPGIDGQALLIKAGMGARALPVGTQETIYKETAVSATHTGIGITAIAVDEEAFLAAEHESGNKAYEFTYDGAGWKDQNGNAVELTAFGITVTGTPAADDAIVIHETATAIESSVLDHDYDTPTDPAIKHTMTIGMNNCFENRQFDAPEALVACPEGLEEGVRVYVVGDHCAYDNSTSEDGNYGFTPTTRPGDVRYIRHTKMGESHSPYSADKILAGKFVTYDATFTKIEEVATDSGTTGTRLGTVTAESPTYKVGDNVNYTRRNFYGSGDYSTSAIRQYLNAVGLGWWKQQTPFDFPPDNVAAIKGFLTGIDPSLRAHMQTVKKTYTKHTVDGGGLAVVEDKVFLLGMTETNFGANNDSYESSYGLNNTLKTVPYAYYKDATNADRIKLLNSSARHWFLRGSYPSFCNNVRGVLVTGSLFNNYASTAYGLVAACVIG